MPFHVVCLEPGAGNPKKHTPPPEPEPPEGFVDNTVYQYKLDKDGNEVLIGTMDAFPEGWHRSKTDWEKGFQKKKEEDKMARYDWKALWPQAQELLAQGLSTAKVAEKLGIDAPALRCKIDRERRKAEKQTPAPEPAQAANQEPERETAEPAENIITEKGCPFDEEAFNPNPPEDNDFTAEDDEPIPYTVTEEKFFNLDSFKMRVLEIFQEVAAQNEAPANISLAFIDAIINTYPEVG